VNRDRQVRQVTAELESLLDRLRSNVTALNTILVPGENGAGNAAGEQQQEPEEVSRDQPA
jgi:hypothetical protein